MNHNNKPPWILNCLETENRRLWLEQEEATEVYLEAYFQADSDKQGYLHLKLYPRGPDIQVALTKIFQKNNTSLEPNYNDMVEMPVLNQPEIIQNLKLRYNKMQIFTRIGPTLIIINPYQNIPALEEQVLNHLILQLRRVVLTENNTKISIGEFLSQFDAHVFSLAALAYKQMLQLDKNQALVISGESGAGKTENTKFAMKLLTCLSKDEKPQWDESVNHIMVGIQKFTIEEQILSCNPILEAFGNARTIKNDNSSRFGKFVKIFFLPQDAKIQGASILNYLLEKSRLPQQQQGERNYHIFYQLIQGAEDHELEEFGLKLDSLLYNDRACFIKSFNYLKGDPIIQTINDKQNFGELQMAFIKMGFNNKQIISIFRLITSVLYLGNLQFAEETLTDTMPCQIANTSVLEQCLKLLEVDQESFTNSIVFKQRKIGQQQMIMTPMRKEECQATKDALAKWLYEALFNYLVQTLNKKLNPSEGTFRNIGLLDIFGFENFKVNSFEQLCINFTNEKLLQLYIHQVFKCELMVYQNEQLESIFQNVIFEDNQSLIDLVEKPPLGLFPILDDITQLGSGTDDQYLQKLIASFDKKNPHFKINKLLKESFILVHTASEVEYNCRGFRSKNKDEMSEAIFSVLQHSSMNLIQSLGQTQVTTKSKCLSLKFRNSLNDLMQDLFECDVHFIRCLKPNEQKSKNLFNTKFILTQIRYLGIFDSIKMKKNGHAYKFLYEDFIQVYGQISKQLREYGLEKLKIQTSEQLIQILKKCLFDPYFPKQNEDSCDYAFGVTKLFLKDKSYDHLERLLKAHRLNQAQKAIKIVNQFRKWRQKTILLKRVRILNRFLFNLIRVQIKFKQRLGIIKLQKKQQAYLKFESICQKKQKNKFFQKMSRVLFATKILKLIISMKEKIFLRDNFNQWKQTIRQISNSLKLKEIEDQQFQDKLKSINERQSEILAEKKELLQRLEELAAQYASLEQEKKDLLGNSASEQAKVKSNIDEVKPTAIEEAQTADQMEMSPIQLFKGTESEIIESLSPSPKIQRERENPNDQSFMIIPQPLDGSMKESVKVKRLSVQQVEQIIYGPSLISNLSELSIVEIINLNVKTTQTKSFVEHPWSEDVAKDWNSINKILMEKVATSNYQDHFSQMIPKKSKWGKAITFNELFKYSNKVLSESLTNLKHAKYKQSSASLQMVEQQKNQIKRGTVCGEEMRQSIIGKGEELSKKKMKQPQLTEKQVASLASLIEQYSIEANKLMLKFAGDYNSSKSSMECIVKLLNIIYEFNVDPMFPRNDKNKQQITQWQFNLIEEIYLQLIKQTISSQEGEKHQIPYMKQLSIIASYIPTGKSIFWPILNYLNCRINSGQNQEILKYCKFIFCRIVRSNLRYIDSELYQIMMPSESKEETSPGNISLFRQLMPKVQELGLVQNMKKIMIQVYLMNGAAVEISIESLTTVKKCVLQCLQELGMQSIFSKAENFTLMEYLRLHNGQKIERYLDDSDKVMDTITQWQYDQEKIISPPPKQLSSDEKSSFSEQMLGTRKLFLTIRAHFKQQEGNPQQTAIFFVQGLANVMNGKLSLREDDYLNLAALKILTEQSRISLDEIGKLPLHYYLPIHIIAKFSPISTIQIIQIVKESSTLYYLIIQGYQKLMTYDQYVAQNAYLEYLRAHPLYFSLDFYNVFASEYKSSQSCTKEQVVIAIGSQYICFCQEATKQIKKKILIEKIVRWGSTDSEFYMNDENGVKYSFESEQAPFMAFIFSKYVK